MGTAQSPTIQPLYITPTLPQRSLKRFISRVRVIDIYSSCNVTVSRMKPIGRAVYFHKQSIYEYTRKTSSSHERLNVTF